MMGVCGRFVVLRQCLFRIERYVTQASLVCSRLYFCKNFVNLLSEGALFVLGDSYLDVF